ncbi:MAG: glycosyltransferase [Propionibacteriaceae bacterium]|nr:glycosyltransferase [Propionibacteriaceae bacterium]
MSVVVPVLNVAHLLPRCLDSLLAQTHRPLEIIVVDDGSTDDSAEVMRRYEQRHSEVHLVSQRHRGVGPARNAGLSIAKGAFVSMVDADDWVEPEFIADLLAIAMDTGADVVVGGFSFDFLGLEVPFPFLPRTHSMTGPEAAELSIHMTRFPAFAWNKLYRRDLFRADDPPFPSIYYEDLATTPRILLRASEVALTRTVYYHYCLRGDGITGNFRAKNVFSFAAAIDILRRDLTESGLWEAWLPSYRRLLRQALAMMTLSVLLQRNHIPLGVRLPLLFRFGRLLKALSLPPQDGRRLRAVRLSKSGAESSRQRRPVSAAVAVGGRRTPGSWRPARRRPAPS